MEIKQLITKWYVKEEIKKGDSEDLNWIEAEMLPQQLTKMHIKMNTVGLCSPIPKAQETS